MTCSGGEKNEYLMNHRGLLLQKTHKKKPGDILFNPHCFRVGKAFLLAIEKHANWDVHGT